MPKPLPVALVYGDSESSQVLRHALGEIGADLVCDADIGNFNLDSLGASGADVVLISLDAAIEDRLDDIYGALDENRYRVMFDDPEISNELDGWEHARWQRHLAAKLRDVTDWDPPRPEDAAPVEVHATGAEAAAADAASDDWMDDALAVLGASDAEDDESPRSEQVSDSLSAEAAESGLAPPETAQPGFIAPQADAAGMAASSEEDFISNAAFRESGELETASQKPDEEDTPTRAVSDSEPPRAPEPDSTAGLSAAGDMDDTALQAELDALAEADDPLAALSAMAGEKGIAGAETDTGLTRADAALDADDATAEGAWDPDTGPESGEMAGTHEVDELSLDAPEFDGLPDSDAPEPEQAQIESGSAGASPGENPSATPSGDSTDAADEDVDWDALEAELNSAFDSDTLGAIDQAASADEAEADEAPTWELQGEVDAGTPDADEAQPDEQLQALSATDSESADTEQEQMTAPTTPADDASADSAATETSRVDPDSTADKAFELPDVSQWALVEDDDMPEPDSSGDDAAASVGRSEPAPAAPEQADGEAGDAEEADDDNFGLELVDPIDYLKPEAPKDISNELFSMPKLMPMAEAVAPKVGDEDEDEATGTSARIEHVVVLGASIGGPDAVREFLSHLPQQLPASLILVQHLGSEFVDLMVSQLSKSSALPVRIPGRAERVVHGEVLVVPSGSLFRLAADGQAEVRNQDDAAGKHPSINATMCMAAEVFGARATAIIFSGMADDAAVGALEIASRGGEVWVQDPDSCVVSNMVDEVVAAGVARFTGTPEALAHKLVAYLQETDDD